MSLRLAIFASLVGMASSASTTSAAPSNTEALVSSSTPAPMPTLTTSTPTRPTTMATSTKPKAKTTASTSSTYSTISAPSPASSTAPPTSTSAKPTSTAPAKTVSIAVGESGLSFTPNSVSASIGDVLLFSFYPRNHSVALGSWDKACAPSSAGGFFSGFIPVDEDESNVNTAAHFIFFATHSDRQLATFRVTVSTADPLVFYCTAGRHCQDGMYGVVNPANSSNSEASGHNLASYAVMAKNASSNISPPAVMGGTLAFNGTTINETTNGTVCGGNSANITSASTWCIPYIPNISSNAAALERSIWAVMAAAMVGAVCLM